jgi:uncharacterized membrane protein
MNIPFVTSSSTEDNHPVIALKDKRTLGQRTSDRITKILGSWTFIIIFISYLVLWVSINVYEFVFRSWDPFPFILLNLTLSCVSALQAPLILMSQNRQAERDRVAAKYDYAVNKKAEREIQQALKELQEIKAMLQENNKTKKNPTV